MAFDVTQALQDGHTQDDILNEVQRSGKFDVAKARQDGHSDAEILQAVQQGPPSASPQGPAGPTPPPPAPSGITDALEAGLASSVAAGQRGFSGALRYAGIAPKTADAADNMADQNDTAAGKLYQPSLDIAGTYADTYGSGGAGAVAKKAVYGAAEALPGAIPALGAAGLGLAGNIPAGIAAAGLTGLAAAQALGAVRSEKTAQGLDSKNVTTLDMGNAAAQTFLQTAKFETLGLGPIGAQLLHAADSGGRAAISEGANVLGAYLQGGDPGTAASIADKLISSGVTGLLTKPAFDVATAPFQAASGAIADRYTRMKAGANLRAYGDETADWSKAVGDAATRLQAANPDMPAPEVQDRAYTLAQRAGATPPTFETLSPAAQNGQAELAAIQMYGAAKQSITAGMGRPDADVAPTQVFKNMTQTIAGSLKEMATTLGQLGPQGGGIDPAQAKDFAAAIEEARVHNRQSGENGMNYGWFDTLRDKVAALPMDPAYRNQALQMLRVLDISSQAGLYKNSKGPLERNAGLLVPAMVAGVAGLATGGAGAESLAAGSIGGRLIHAQGVSALRGLDALMGHGLPDVLQRQAAIESFAQQHNLSAVADPVAMQAINAHLRGLQAPTAPPGPAMPDQSMPQATNGPGPTPQTVQAPRPAGYAPAAASTPIPGPSVAPQGPTAPPVAPQGPPVAPPLTAPIQTRLTGAPVRPIQAPPPQVAPQVPPGPIEAQAAIQRALSAKAAQYAQQVQQAFPTDRTGWSNAISQQTGVSHDALMSHINGLIADGKLPPAMAAELQQKGPISNDLMRAITGRVNDLADRGVLPRGPQGPLPAGQDLSGVRNPAAYEANLAQEYATAESARKARPDLSHIVDAIRDPLANGKTSEGRQDVLSRYLETIADPKERASQEAIMRPLTGYGRKGK